MRLSDFIRNKHFNSIIINISDGPGTCHLRCTYCSLNGFRSEKPVVMTEDNMRLACQYIKWHFGEKAHLHFFGTEPLMFPKLLFLARRLMPDSTITVTTNGVQLQLDETLSDELQKHDIRITILSCDGPYHDQHRLLPNGEGSFKYVKRAWELLPDYKWTDVTLRATWLPHQRLVEFYKFQQREFGTLHITPIPDILSTGWKEKDVAEQVMELADFLRGELVNSLQYKIVFDSITKRITRRTFCNMSEFAIDPNLDVYGCHHLPRQTRYGSIVTNEVYPEGVEFIERHIKLVKMPIMRECEYCHANVACPVTGECTAAFLQMTGRAHVPPAHYCEFARGFVSGVFYWLSLAQKQLLSEQIIPNLLKGGSNNG